MQRKSLIPMFLACSLVCAGRVALASGPATQAARKFTGMVEHFNFADEPATRPAGTLAFKKSLPHGAHLFVRRRVTMVALRIETEELRRDSGAIVLSIPTLRTEQFDVVANDADGERTVLSFDWNYIALHGGDWPAHFHDVYIDGDNVFFVLEQYHTAYLFAASKSAQKQDLQNRDGTSCVFGKWDDAEGAKIHSCAFTGSLADRSLRVTADVELFGLKETTRQTFRYRINMDGTRPVLKPPEERDADKRIQRK